MAFSFVQTKQGATGGATSLVITLDSAATQGNLLVINVKLGGVGAINPTVTDNAGTPNTYALAVGPIDSSPDFRCYQLYGVQVTGGATQITISWTNSAAARITVDEYSGGAATNATVFDQSTSNTGSGTSASVASFSPAATGELIAVGVGFTGASGITAGTNYTLATSHANQSAEYRLSSAASETAPMSWTGTLNWAEVVGVYKVPATSIKTVNGLAIASVKTFNNLAIANVKSINNLQ